MSYLRAGMVCLFFVFACAGGGSDAPVAGQRYLIQPKASEMCVDVPGGSMDEGKQLIIWTINNKEDPSQNQVWKLVAAGDEGEYKIVSEQSKMCLSVEGLEDLAPVVQLLDEDGGEDEDADGSNRIWTFEKRGGYYAIVSKLSKKLLTVNGWSTDRGATLAQFEALPDADNQAFSFSRIGAK